MQSLLRFAVPLRQTVVAASLGAAFACSPIAHAQEGVLHGLGWVTTRPGTEISGQSAVRSINNRSNATVEAGGGKASAGLGVAGSVDLIATALANTVGLDALMVRSTQIDVQRNHTSGAITAFGGAATANSVLISGGAGRKPLDASRFNLQNNRAGTIDALGASATVLLGLGSLQLPGRASANSVLIDDSAVRTAQIANLDNQADRLRSTGGAALANTTTVARSTLQNLRVTQTGNRAQDIAAGGASAGLGWGAVASIDLSGVAAANALTVAGSRVQGATVVQQGNQADRLWAPGGGALGNSVNIADYQGASLSQYRALLSNNRANNVAAGGGSGTVLKGGLADVSKDASALANSVSVQGGDLRGANRHTLSGNTATDVQAIGGAAAANGVWLKDASVGTSDIAILNNVAQRIDTAGGSASLGSGAVGAFERNGRALANAVALDPRAQIANAPIAIADNRASGVQGSGGLAAANSLLVADGRVGNGTVRIAGNIADDVRATGFAGSVGGGLLFSTQQSARALANGVAVQGSHIDPAALLISNNRARQLSAQGGQVNANGVSVEQGAAGASRLAAAVAISGNEATRLQSGASAMAGPGHAFGSDSAARAAANSLVLSNDARIDAGSAVRIAGNRATGIGAVGGTALVNTMAGYRGARVEASPVTISQNRADDVAAGGGYGQVAGVGSAKNGILVANGVYLEGDVGVRLSQSPVAFFSNTAHGLNADGGRINANALAVNGNGAVDASAFLFARNRADDIASLGSERTLAGHAVIGRGVGHASANSVQAMGSLRDSAMQLTDNAAFGVRAAKGSALANSVVVDGGGSSQAMPVTLSANRANGVTAQDGNTASVNSVLNEGRVDASGVALRDNQGSASASAGDALVNSVRNHARGSVEASTLALSGNRGGALRNGSVNSVDNARVISSSRIDISGNRGSASGAGVANGVVNQGHIASSQIQILGNQGSADGGGLVNSIGNDGRIASSRILIAGNHGSARGGGTVNSVKNASAGTLTGARIAILGNQGTANGGGTVNSVDNRGRLSGVVDIVGNRGTANGGGTVNSVVNRGTISGRVLIAGNQGTASAGGTANSVVNRGVISGSVAIIGSQSAAGPVMTMGSVRVTPGGAMGGAAGVAANVPFATGGVVLPATGVILNSVTVGPAVTALHL